MLGRLLFSVAKEWRTSDQGDKTETARLVKNLIDGWKVKYFGKATRPSPTKPEQQAAMATEPQGSAKIAIAEPVM